MRELVARSWSELQEQLFAESWNADLKRHRSSFAFRGCGDATFVLSTSLLRLGGAAARIESSLMRSFRRYARSSVVADDSIWSWLTLAQQHGLPTRLLDWTFSPYVALHFATEDPSLMDQDGVVWAVDYVNARNLLPEALASALAEEEAFVFPIGILTRLAPSMHDLEAFGGDFVVFFEPPSIDERLVNQHALFSVMPCADAPPSAWLERHDELVRRIVVPRSLKAEVRDKLDQANINERIVYPGLDGLSRWLARYYAPRP